MRRANAGGAGGDGLIQRFGLLVWPDAPTGWRNVERYPDGTAREEVYHVFDRAAGLDMGQALRLGASKDQFDTIPYFRFDAAAYDDFLGWRTDLETRLRSGELPAAIEGHLAKYRTFVPALALINAIADGDQFAVSQQSLQRALAFTRYLESHVLRVYGSATEGETAAATAILKHIKAGSLDDGFTVRDILRRTWVHLPDSEQVTAGLSLLCDLDYLVAEQLPIGPQGGRPKTTYTINPKVKG